MKEKLPCIASILNFSQFGEIPPPPNFKIIVFYLICVCVCPQEYAFMLLSHIPYDWELLGEKPEKGECEFILHCGDYG